MTTGPGFPHHSILEKKNFSEVSATKKILKVRKFQPGRIIGYKTLVETEVRGV